MSYCGFLPVDIVIFSWAKQHRKIWNERCDHMYIYLATVLYIPLTCVLLSPGVTELDASLPTRSGSRLAISLRLSFSIPSALVRFRRIVLTCAERLPRSILEANRSQ